MARFYRKIVKKIAPELRKVLNSELQGLSGEKSALYKFWWLRWRKPEAPLFERKHKRSVLYWWLRLDLNQ